MPNALNIRLIVFELQFFSREILLAIPRQLFNQLLHLLFPLLVAYICEALLLSLLSNYLRYRHESALVFLFVLFLHFDGFLNLDLFSGGLGVIARLRFFILALLRNGILSICMLCERK